LCKGNSEVIIAREFFFSVKEKRLEVRKMIFARKCPIVLIRILLFLLLSSLFIFPLSLKAEEQTATNQSKTNNDRDQSVTVDHGSRIKLGGITIGAGYSHFSGPGWYPAHYGGYFPYWGMGWYPWGYYPSWEFWGYPSYYPMVKTAGSGEIKIRSPEKNAGVYIDGAYAGIVDNLKSFWLQPGAYNLELRNLSGGTYQKRLYVLSGKTLKVTPVFSVSGKED
jgi:hypothetical protein